ncbi:hypothetical protein BDY19DRAFT_995954 [Irpex rosettiformis]|uniref:Uncharacterized protein n=1 Tax=Irpex rosettiformis TaxID=378272 RepID=A0ACB8TX16_9APHY|nr:hypothetical protein BDY19DRAFT_995954 [Irpex rosettiformis]
MSSFVKVSAYGDNPSLSQEQLQAMPTKFSNVNIADRETLMYEPLSVALSEAVQAAKVYAPTAPNYVFKVTSDWPEASDEDIMPSLVMYPDTDDARQAFSRGMASSVATEPHTARVAWAWMTVAVEAKWDPCLSAFHFDDEQEFLMDTIEGERAEAQFAQYAAQTMVRQHRVFVFLIYVCQTKVRLARWDRAGCMVSAPINFETEPEKLLNFVYRLTLMSPKELGYSTVAVLATPEEVQQLSRISHISEPCYEGIHRVHCQDSATASWVLEGLWRSDRVPLELDIYKELQAAGVRHVATVIGGGDVEGGSHVTRTDQFVCCIVFKELARPLEHYAHSREMITIVYHALIGHKDAWEKAGILHRDISTGNIMYVVSQAGDTITGTYGILNDWDMCKHKRDLIAGQPQNVGTWAFMSAVSLLYPGKPLELSDDLEAFIHAITFCCLRFHWHDFSDTSIEGAASDQQLKSINSENLKLRSYVSNYYNETFKEKNGTNSGGLRKKATTEGKRWQINMRPPRVAYGPLCGSDRKQPKTTHLLASKTSVAVIQKHNTHTTKIPVLTDEPFEDLHSHSPIMTLFETALSTLANETDLADKTPDQFLGLCAWDDNAPKGATGSRRNPGASKSLMTGASSSFMTGTSSSFMTGASSSIMTGASGSFMTSESVMTEASREPGSGVSTGKRSRRKGKDTSNKKSRQSGSCSVRGSSRKTDRASKGADDAGP